jgi:hypothetical protein
MPIPPESTKTSLRQRLRAHARDRWPTLADLDIRHRGTFAYVDAHLANGDVVPLLQLRYGGSAAYWGVALHRASTGKYEDQIWFTGTPEEALDFAGSTLLIASDALPTTNLRG